ncbi:hypothetical protein P8452_28922 [Trifolium repens]|nr:hypothetical protein P8452_28922 [Trifolium repens]
MVSLSNNKKIKSGLLLVWHTTVWVLWTTRNQKLFDDKDCSDAEMIFDMLYQMHRSAIGQVAAAACIGAGLHNEGRIISGGWCIRNDRGQFIRAGTNWTEGGIPSTFTPSNSSMNTPVKSALNGSQAPPSNPCYWRQ